jgi:hypothetical protein
MEAMHQNHERAEMGNMMGPDYGSREAGVTSDLYAILSLSLILLGRIITPPGEGAGDGSRETMPA